MSLNDDFALDLPTSSMSPFKYDTIRLPKGIKGLKGLQQTLIGQGPSGVGIITKLNAHASSSSTGTVRRARNPIPAFDAELDFDDAPPLKLKVASRPSADALDGFDDLDEEDREATLKASATLKAMLPPPRTIRRQVLEDDFEADLELPDHIQQLSLARPPKKRLSPLTSDTSTSALETPMTSPHSSRWHGRTQTTTTATSTSSRSSKPDQPLVVTAEAEDADDFLDGLALPTPTFFDDGSKLQAILRQRIYQAVPDVQPASPKKQLDESMEDDIEIQDVRAEISRRRLQTNKRERLEKANLGYATGKRVAQLLAKERERRGDGPSRASTMRPTSQRPAITPSTFKSQPSTSSRTETSSSTAQSKARSSLNSMPPPPPPPPPEPKATPSRGLRHQKSQYHLPSPSPTIARKRSLPSLQDTIKRERSESSRSLDQRAKEPKGPSTPSGSLSRLTMPTASSRMKARPPLSNVFPMRRGFDVTELDDIPDLDSPPQVGTVKAGSLGLVGKKTSSPGSGRIMRARPRVRGNGTELDGIEDLQVDEASKKGSQRSTRSSGWSHE